MIGVGKTKAACDRRGVCACVRACVCVCIYGTSLFRYKFKVTH